MTASRGVIWRHRSRCHLSCTRCSICGAIDTAITKNASGAMSLFPSLREELLVLQRKPLTYLTAPPFRWLWAVFFSTYAAANHC